MSKATLRRAVLQARRLASDSLMERRHGIETGRVVDLDDLGLASPDRIGYEPSGWLDLRRALRRRDVGPDDVFIDFGSGKGRVVLEAARLPFRKVIGVELSEELTRQAQANLAARRTALRCADVELISADVVVFDVPDDVTVAYLYNPFRGEVFEAVIDKLIASVDRNPRPLRLIYRTPLEQERIERTGRFELVRVVHGLRPRRHWSWYRSIRVYRLDPRPCAEPLHA